MEAKEHGYGEKEREGENDSYWLADWPVTHVRLW
jgi:hypothetical protein